MELELQVFTLSDEAAKRYLKADLRQRRKALKHRGLLKRLITERRQQRRQASRADA